MFGGTTPKTEVGPGTIRHGSLLVRMSLSVLNHTRSPKGSTSDLHGLLVCLSYAVLWSLPMRYLEIIIAAHLANHWIIGESTLNGFLILASHCSLRTRSMSRVVLPASSTAPLDWRSPLGGCSGVTIPPWTLANASLTAMIAGSPSDLRLICWFGPPGLPQAFYFLLMSWTSHFILPFGPSPFCKTTVFLRNTA